MTRFPIALIWLLAGWGALAEPASFEVTHQSIPWQQVAGKLTFTAFPEREAFSNLDKAARIVFAVEVGNSDCRLADLAVDWALRRDETILFSESISLSSGLTAVSIPLKGLAPGTYQIDSALTLAGEQQLTSSSVIRMLKVESPPQSGRIPLILPRGMPIREGAYPIQCGVPFPKGALWNAENVRLVSASGAAIPCRAIARSRWGHDRQSSIRWLGLDFQASAAAAWWPERQETYAVLEYGPDVRSGPVLAELRVSELSTGLEVSTGPLRFLVKRQGFNLLDQVYLNGQEVVAPASGGGPYLVDQNEAIYRAANDTTTTLTVEEQTDLRVVIRAEGWYVKDGTTGATESYTLPTDKLCKFITRIEAYAGQPYVRVLHTWVSTYDSFSVRLRDVGLALPLQGGTQATFGVEEGEPLGATVEESGVRLVQHLPHQFVLEDGGGMMIAEGQHSAGWVSTAHGGGLLTVALRDTWQRFPKELEVLPDEVRLHVWPAHGRNHPDIDPFAHDQIHKLWFAHQGRELNLAQPWETYLAVARINDNAETGVYKGAGLALAGVHASVMGAAITSDILLRFDAANASREARDTAACFQVAPHAIAEPTWACASDAMGWCQPYDPERFSKLEAIIANTMRGYWETGNEAGEYGMWLYRTWHHSGYDGDGKWELYRLYNATHHYEAFMPWLFYARSGDPFYLTQGSANIRMLSDVQVIHHADPSYPQTEFHFGQKRLVGSTRHTNGFNTWGGDHAVFSHQTCYNAMIMAYYLTGDLRLREVVNEWQTTITADRANPEFDRADRSLNVRPDGTGARDTANAMGELMDLYQMTHHPALLALMGPMVDTFLNQPKAMSTWGQPVHNILNYYQSQQAADSVLAMARAYRSQPDKPDDPHNLWYSHCRHEVLALASILAPDDGYEVDAYLAAEPAMRLPWSQRILARQPQAIKFSTVPDYLLYLPRVMVAVAQNAREMPMLEQLQLAQSLPATDYAIKGWTRCIIQEDVDQAIVLHLTGSVGIGGKGGFPLRVFGPGHKLILNAEVPAGSHSPYVLTIPKDGVTGQYAIFYQARDVADNLLAPLTDLPEVYHVVHWQQNGPTRYYVQSAGDTRERFTVGPIKGSAQLLDRSGTRLLDSLAWGESMTADIGPEGAWIALQCRYAHVSPATVIAISPEKWFAPDPEVLTWLPWDAE